MNTRVNYITYAHKVNETNKIYRIRTCIQFITNNMDLFADFLNRAETINSLLSREEIEKSPLIQGMKDAFTNDTYGTTWVRVANFRNAICGKPEYSQDSNNGLINGSEALINAYLENCPLMVKAIFNNRFDPIIQKWNKLNYVSSLSERNVIRESLSVTPSNSQAFFSSRIMCRQEKVTSKQTLIQESTSNSGWSAYGLFAAGVCAVAASVVVGISLIKK